jgi:hypothetical protein
MNYMAFADLVSAFILLYWSSSTKHHALSTFQTSFIIENTNITYSYKQKIPKTVNFVNAIFSRVVLFQ